MKLNLALPKYELSPQQLIWLREAWNVLQQTGTNPKYRELRIKTDSATGRDFDPKTIDRSLIREEATQITMLGVYQVDPESPIFEDAQKLIEFIRQKLTDNPDQIEFQTTELAGEIGWEPSYLRIVFTLANEYGHLSDGGSYASSEGAPFGYERFSVKNISTFEDYRSFKSIEDLFNEYFERQEEYRQHEERRREVANASPDHQRESAHTELFDLKIVEETRGYVRKIARQASLCYRHGLYDACFVMIRRLIETMIIEAFERHGIANQIKDDTGNFLMLSDLIAAFLNETTWNIGRSVRTGLPRIKKFADLSAHHRRFNATKADLDKLDDLRIVIEELVHIIDYPTWRRIQRNAKTN